VSKCVIARERRHLSTRPVYGVIRSYSYDLFRGCSISAYHPLCDLMENCGPRAIYERPIRIDILYVCDLHKPEIELTRWRTSVDAARLFNGLCTYTFEHAVVKFIWTMSKCVCLSPCCQSINKKTKRFYKLCESFLLPSPSHFYTLSLIYHRMPWKKFIIIGFCW